MVDFDAYASDCRVYGQLELGAGRLSDQINGTEELHILDARLEDLADGHIVAMPELSVGHEELCAVVATGPRGDPARRLNTRTARVEVEVGPYRVVGRVHGPPTADPMARALRVLLCDAALRKALSTAAQALVDGLGAARVADHLFMLLP